MLMLNSHILNSIAITGIEREWEVGRGLREVYGEIIAVW